MQRIKVGTRFAGHRWTLDFQSEWSIAEARQWNMEDRGVSRMLKWERLVLQGDFLAMPVPFRWEESARFAHFLNGYEVAGGFDPLAKLANSMSVAACETGHWRGGALDLWLCLFFEHRAQRHADSDYSGTPILEQLCETLRIALSHLSPEEAQEIASRLSPVP